MRLGGGVWFQAWLTTPIRLQDARPGYLVWQLEQRRGMLIKARDGVCQRGVRGYDAATGSSGAGAASPVSKAGRGRRLLRSRKRIE